MSAASSVVSDEACSTPCCYAMEDFDAGWLVPEITVAMGPAIWKGVRTTKTGFQEAAAVNH